MIDFDRITGFDWDSGNARKNEKHGVSQTEAEQIFFDPRLLVMIDSLHSSTEARHHALGATLDGRRLRIAFTLRGSGTLIRVISARGMHRKERRIYESEG